MKCPACGQQCRPNALICIECGQSILSAQSINTSLTEEKNEFSREGESNAITFQSNTTTREAEKNHSTTGASELALTKNYLSLESDSSPVEGTEEQEDPSSIGNTRQDSREFVAQTVTTEKTRPDETALPSSLTQPIVRGIRPKATAKKTSSESSKDYVKPIFIAMAALAVFLATGVFYVIRKEQAAPVPMATETSPPLLDVKLENLSITNSRVEVVNEKGLLRVSAIITNLTDAPQPLPLFTIGLEDRNGAPLSRRTFFPAEYAKVSQLHLLPHSPLTVVVEIADSDREAVGFKLDICAENSGKLECSFDSIGGATSIEFINLYAPTASSTATRPDTGGTTEGDGEVFLSVAANGSLRQGESVIQTIPLPVLTELVFRGNCDSDCSGLDVVLLDAANNTLAGGTSAGALPAFAIRTGRKVTPPSLRITMTSCSVQPCSFKVNVFEKHSQISQPMSQASEPSIGPTSAPAESSVAANNQTPFQSRPIPPGQSGESVDIPPARQRALSQTDQAGQESAPRPDEPTSSQSNTQEPGEAAGRAILGIFANVLTQLAQESKSQLNARSTARGNCTTPKPPGFIPDGNSASKEEMLTAKAQVMKYKQDVDAYNTCLNNELQAQLADDALSDESRSSLQSIANSKREAASAELNRVAARFNEQVKVYKSNH